MNAIYRVPCIIAAVAVLAGCQATNGGAPIHSGGPYPNSAMHWPSTSRYDIPPKLVHATTPIYPETQHGRSGWAVVAFTIDTSGRPRNIHIVKASHADFSWPTIAAVRMWQFEPAQKNGEPVAVEIEFHLPFISNGPNQAMGLTSVNENTEQAARRAAAKPNGVAKTAQSMMRAIYTPRPEIPDIARAKQLHGSGNFALHLRPDGTVSRVDIVKSTGHKVLDDAAVAAFEMAI